MAACGAGPRGLQNLRPEGVEAATRHRADRAAACSDAFFAECRGWGRARRSRTPFRAGVPPETIASSGRVAVPTRGTPAVILGVSLVASVRVVDPVAMERVSSRLLAWIVAVLAFAAQVPGFARAWIWDDELLFGGTDLYTNAARWSESLTKPLGGETFYWRPLATTSFLAGSLIHGVDALWFRVTSAGLHAVLAAVVFLLALRLVKNRGVAFGAATLWALHPAHVETVTWISGRFDLLAGLFGGVALLAVPAAGTKSRTRSALVGAAAFLAMLAKENAVLLPVLVALWALACAATSAETEAATTWRARLRGVAGPSLAAAAGVGAALFARLEATGMLFGLRSPPAADVATDRVAFVGRAVTEYVATLCAPWTFAGPAHHVARPAGGAAAWAGIALLAAAVVAIVVVIARRRGAPAAWLGAALVVALLPVLQIVPIDLAGQLIVADRYLYLPSVFAALLGTLGAAAITARGDKAARGLAAGAVVVALSFVAVRVVILPRWNDPVRFWAWAADMAPGSGFVHVSYGNALRRAGDLDGAEREARIAEAVHPRLLAEVMIDRGRLDAAILVLDAAVSAGRADPDTRLFRAECLVQAGDAVRAGQDADAVLKALGDESRAYRPLRPTALAVAAGALATLGDQAAAARALAEAERIARPDDVRAWTTITVAAVALRDVDRVAAASKRARDAGAPEIGMRTHVADSLADAGRHAEAALEFRRILELDPPQPAVFLDRLGYELFDAGDTAGAEKALREAVATSPTFARARYHLAFLLAKSGRKDEAREEANRLGELLAKSPDSAISHGLAALRAALVD